MDNIVCDKLLDVMYTSVVLEGGDGDALWLSKHMDLDTIMGLIKEYNKNNNTGWGVEKSGNHIAWGIDQEWVLITDDENFYNNQPEWIILRINF